MMETMSSFSFLGVAFVFTFRAEVNKNRDATRGIHWPVGGKLKRNLCFMFTKDPRGTVFRMR